MHAIVTAEHIGKVYRGGIPALQDVSFNLFPGRIVLLLGPNGAGKSSLVHIACQVTRPSTGSIRLGIRDGGDLGWCSQSQMIDWWATVLDNVTLGPLLCGRTHRQARVDALAALDLVGLGEHAGRLVDRLSGGQLQRVQVARALAHRPRLMFLDEPTVGLDAGTANKLLAYLRRQADEGATIVIASHELDAVEAYGNEVLLLDRGRLIEHTSRQAFVQAWSAEEIAQVDLQEDLPAERLAALAEVVIEVQQAKPLRARIARGQGHRLLQVLLAEGAGIKSFELETPGLKEAFLRYQEARGAGPEVEP